MVADEPRAGDLSIAELLKQLSQLRQAPSTTRELTEIWCAEAGLVPGTCRVPASALYAEWRAWSLLREPNRQIGMADWRVWGMYMKTRYRRGRGNRGKFYYVSRSG